MCFIGLGLQAQEDGKKEIKVKIIKKTDDGQEEVIEKQITAEEDQMIIIDGENILFDSSDVKDRVVKVFVEGDSVKYVNVSKQMRSPFNAPQEQLGLGVYFDQSYSNNLVIRDVIDNSPADESGLNKGDVLLSIEGETVSNISDVQSIIANHAEGDQLTVKIIRYGEITEKKVELRKVQFNRLSSFNRERNMMKPFRWNEFNPKGKAKLGIMIRDTEDGVIVEEVFPQSLGEEIGLMIDDIIMEINEEAIDIGEDLREILRDLNDGDKVKLKVKRDKKKKLELEGEI
jgi:S1-C subfamily serine protease